MKSELDVRIERQPDYTTCGPTALHAIYRYYGDPIDLATVMPRIESTNHDEVAERLAADFSTQSAVRGLCREAKNRKWSEQ